MVKLYELVKDEGGALRTLDAAAAAMEAEKSKDAAVHAKRFRMLAADMRLSSQDSDQALSALEAKVAQGDKDQTNLARLVSLLCAKGEVDKADKYAAMLPALAEAGYEHTYRWYEAIKKAPETDAALAVLKEEARAAQRKRESRDMSDAALDSMFKVQRDSRL